MGPHCRGRARPARGSARPPFNGQLPLTPRAGHARPLPRGCHRLPGWAGVGGLVRRGGIHASRDVCGGGNSAGRIYAAPANRSEKWRLWLVCRGCIHASRETLRRRKHPGRDKSLPYALPANYLLHGGASGTPPPTEVSRKRLPAVTPRAGHCGVVSVGPRLSGAKPGANNVCPRGANNRTSGPALLAGGARCAPPSARPLQRAAKPPHFCLCPRAQTPQYLLFIISYLLFAPFVV